MVWFYVRAHLPGCAAADQLSGNVKAVSEVEPFNLIVVAVNLRTSVRHESLQTCPTSKALTCASAHANCKLIILSTAS